MGRPVPGSLDPRTKILGCGALLLPFLLPDSPWVRVACLAYLGILWYLGRVPVRAFLLALGGVALLLATTILYYGPRRGIAVDLGIIGVTFVLVFLVSSTPPLELAEGLELLLSPLARLGLPVHEGTMIFLLSLRFIPLVGREASFLLLAARSRGAFSGRRRGARLGDLLSLVLPLVVRSLVRASELAEAMDSRCYQGAKGRTSVRVYALRRRDGVFLSASLAWAVASVALALSGA